MHHTKSRRHCLATLAAAAVTLLVPAAAHGARPLQDRFPVDAVFEDAALSDACGFPVTIGFEGTFAITVFINRDGSVRELDTQPGTKLIFTGPGGRYVAPFSASLHTTYPQGALVGAPAILTYTGNNALGIDAFVGPGTGRAELTGIVVAVEDGFPLTRFTELVTTSGHCDPDATARICAALAT
jgi:hypothetical protein